MPAGVSLNPPPPPGRGAASIPPPSPGGWGNPDGGGEAASIPGRSHLVAMQVEESDGGASEPEGAGRKASIGGSSLAGNSGLSGVIDGGGGSGLNTAWERAETRDPNLPGLVGLGLILEKSKEVS